MPEKPPETPKQLPLLVALGPSSPAPWQAFIAPPVSSSMTIRELGDRRLDELRAAASPSLPHVESAYRRHLYPAFGDQPITEPRARDFTAWAKWLMSPRHPSKLEHGTVRKVLGYIAPAFDVAVASGALERNPARLERGALGTAPEKDELEEARAILKLDDFELLISSPKIPFDRRLLYALLLLAGLRFGEAAALRWRDYQEVEPPLAELTIKWKWNSSKRKLEPSTKSKRTRHVPVHPVLASYLAEARVHFRRAFGREPGPRDLIAFRLSRRGRQAHLLNSMSLRAWYEDLEAVGLEPRVLHKCRHAFLTRLEECGADEKIYKRFTHPPKGGTAFQRYQHFDWVPRCRTIVKLRVRGTAAQTTIF
jgi:integrase